MKTWGFALLSLAFSSLGCSSGARHENLPAETHSAPEAPTPNWVNELDRSFPNTTPASLASIRRVQSDLVAHVDDYRQRSPLGIVLPNDAKGTVKVRSRNGELGIRFRLLGARSAFARVERNKVVYQHAGPFRADLALRISPRGVEDFLHFSEELESNSVSYEVGLDGVKAVRLVSNTVEYIGAAGVPRLRTTRALLRDARGQKRFAKTTLSDCAHDTDSRPPWGRSLVSPQSDHCTLTVSWDGTGLEHPVTLDPGWVATDDLADARSFHTATPLGDGKVLVTGGQQDGTPLASSELYDDASETWTMVDDLARARYLHTATRLENSGNVLVLGGYDENGAKLRVSESYDSNWTSVTPMPEARAEHTATRLPNDTVVVVGGGGLSALLYDPDAAEWTSVGTAETDRYGHASVYVDGLVLAIGGSSTPLPAEEALNSVEAFDPPNGPFTTLPPMRYGRHGHTATLLDNERVLVVGKARDAEIYDALSERWEITASPPTAGRWYHAAVELTSNELGDQVLFVGGLFGDTTYDSSEFFVPDGERWTRLDLRMNAKRFAHRATALNPGAVLLSGGQQGFGEALAVTEKIVFIEPGQPCDTSGECFTGHCVDGVCCESACEGECQACSVRRGSSANGVCDVLAAEIPCTAGVGECAVDSTCDGTGADCEVSEFESDGRSCDDELEDTSNDRCHQGICRGTRGVEPPPGGAAGTGGEPATGGTGGAGGTAGTGGEAGMGPEPDAGEQVLPTPLSCSLGYPTPARAPTPSPAWWGLLAWLVARRRAGGRKA